jgi:hypothetical protein
MDALAVVYSRKRIVGGDRVMPLHVGAIGFRMRCKASTHLKEPILGAITI